MKLLIDDKTGREHGLNANEACIYAAILKCSKSGRGWFSNYRELANALPFVISHVSVYRAIQKLITLGIIEKRENTLFALLQNETSLLQNETTLLQNETKSNPPYNPPIINNNKIKASMQTNFEKFWILFSPSAQFNNRRTVTKISFERRSIAAQNAIIKDLELNGHDTEENPYFYVQDFPEPQPEFLKGNEVEKDLVQVKYNGRFRICTRATMELYELEFVRDWN